EDQLEQAFQRKLDLDPGYRLDDEVSGWPAAKDIAIVYVSGVIVSGPSSRGGLLSGRTAGSDTIVRQLDQARRDDAVQAVVLRVDSPGGSAFASDEIWRATQRLRDAGKPLVVSMGGVAASGGYYVSSGADVIFAEPGTITGSIGVFSGKFSAAELFNTVGISTEILSRGRNAAMYSMARPLDDEELATMDRLVGVTYDQFKSRVQEGRHLSADEVEDLARGRVWSGTAAVGKRLVDELGGFDAAIARAKQEAGLGNAKSVELVTYGDRREGPLPRRTVQMLARALVDTDGAAAAALGTGWLEDQPLLSGSLSQIGTWARLADDPVWAILPWGLEIR
ncbi:MAG: signal peptide peptidase SppA, partial [Oligoflexia bacterium]|nr:signal peptide peptidase SppA [Oligoflexia bacterium]